MVKIALTGRIASGKSTVANYLAAKGFEVMDGDKVAHAQLDDWDIQLKILYGFGEEVFTDGKVDRKKLGPLVFADEKLRKRLETYLRGPLEKAFFDFLAPDDKGFRVLESYNILQTSAGRLAQEIWVVDCPEWLQLQQLLARNQFDEAEAKRRILAQPQRSYYNSHATVRFTCTGDENDLHRQVDTILKYRGWGNE